MEMKSQMENTELFSKKVLPSLWKLNLCWQCDSGYLFNFHTRVTAGSYHDFKERIDVSKQRCYCKADSSCRKCEKKEIYDIVYNQLQYMKKIRPNSSCYPDEYPLFERYMCYYCDND